jgi:ectoine hydroxylase-related dioxygenase (phytanoyl-CoA dioxygenase family)
MSGCERTSYAELNEATDKGCHLQVKELSLSGLIRFYLYAVEKRSKDSTVGSGCDNQFTKVRRCKDTSEFPCRYRVYYAVTDIDGSAEGKRVKAFHEVKACDLTPCTLQDEIRSKGYVLIRGLLPQEAVSSVLGDVTQVLSSAGWLLPGPDPQQRMADTSAVCGDPDPTFKRVYQEVFNLESFHALPHQPALLEVMKMLVGEQVLVHPKPIGRLIFPRCERLVTTAHQDYEFMGGDPEFFTAWIPLHDCPVNVGPLRILEGSHRFGVQRHERENLHVPAIPEEKVAGDGWVGGDVNAGDVLIFHSLIVHAASPNSSNRLRLSLDCRFQDARRTLNPANLVFAGESGKSWEKTYAGWGSDALKFYWKRIPLTLEPSKVELSLLAETAELSSARARYARMVSQLD